MTLKDVFPRYNEKGELLRRGMDLYSRHGRLKDRFVAFQRCIEERLKRAGFPGSGAVKVIEASGEQVFGIHFCGEEFRFCLDVLDTGNVRGVVTCIARSAHHQFEPVEVGSFSFNEDGYTDDPDGKGSLRIDETEPAIAILVAFLLAAFEEKGRTLVRSVRPAEVMA